MASSSPSSASGVSTGKCGNQTFRRTSARIKQIHGICLSGKIPRRDQPRHAVTDHRDLFAFWGTRQVPRLLSALRHTDPFQCANGERPAKLLPDTGRFARVFANPPQNAGRGRCRSSTLRAPGTSPCAIRSRNGLTSICSGQAARHLGISSCVHCRSQLRRSACSITPPENRQNQTALPARITHLATQEPGGLQRPALFGRPGMSRLTIDYFFRAASTFSGRAGRCLTRAPQA